MRPDVPESVTVDDGCAEMGRRERALVACTLAWLSRSPGPHALHTLNSTSLLRLELSPLFSPVHRSAFSVWPQSCGFSVSGFGGETFPPLVSCCSGNSEQPGEGGGRWEVVTIGLVDTSPSNFSALGLWKE